MAEWVQRTMWNMDEPAKKCLACKEIKPLTDFYDHKNGLLGKQSKCKPCFNVMQAEIRRRPDQRAKQNEREKPKRQSEEYRKYHREYKKRPDQRAKQRVRDRKHDAKRGKTPERRAWKATFNAQRYGMMKSSGEFTAADIATRLQLQRGYCIGCGRKFSDELPYELDHNIPVSRGGASTLNNLLLLCRSDNASKGSKTFAEWQMWKYKRGVI